MIIKKATLSQNDHNKLVESLAVLFSTGNPSNIIKGIATAVCCQTADLNDKAMEEDIIAPEDMGSLSALSPMEIATTVEVLMSVAYQAGKESKS
jgi:ribosomal protein L10